MTTILQQADAGSGERGALALACGSAVNQDGRSSSLTSPNGPSQQVTGTLHFSSFNVVSAVTLHGTTHSSKRQRGTLNGKW